LFAKKPVKADEQPGKVMTMRVAMVAVREGRAFMCESRRCTTERSCSPTVTKPISAEALVLVFVDNSYARAMEEMMDLF
jgi:hypothetical protein